MRAIKTITVRLPGLTWERLCQLAEISEELPSETARGILKEFLANLDIAQLDQKSSKTEEPSELEALLKTGAADPDRVRKRIAEGRRPATEADLEKLRTGKSKS